MSEQYQKGFASAMESKCALESLPNYLEGISNEMLNETELSLPEMQHLGKELELDTQANKIEKNRIDQRIVSVKRLLKSREELLENNELDRFSTPDFFSKNEQSDHFLSFAIGTIIILLLTLYLLLFYSSTGFSMLYGVPATGNGIFNPSIFSVALSRGGGAIGFVILFPVIFLAVGFAMYVALDKRNNLPFKQGGKSNLWLGLIVSTTFIMDAIIGYKIAQGIYIRDYNIGLHEAPWSAQMAFSDVNFFLVMILGFAAYIIWGYLLNYILNHPYRKTHLHSTYAGVDIPHLQEEIVLLLEQLKQLEDQSDKIEKECQFKMAAAHSIRGGKIPHPVKILILEKGINEFMQGYLSYARNALQHLDHFEIRLNQISATHEKWLNTKIKSLTT